MAHVKKEKVPARYSVHANQLDFAGIPRDLAINICRLFDDAHHQIILRNDHNSNAPPTTRPPSVKELIIADLKRLNIDIKMDSNCNNDDVPGLVQLLKASALRSLRINTKAWDESEFGLGGRPEGAVELDHARMTEFFRSLLPPEFLRLSSGLKFEVKIWRRDGKQIGSASALWSRD